MDSDIKSRIQRYIDETSLLLSLMNDARPKASAKADFGNNLIASGAGAFVRDVARDLLGTGSGFYGTARKATLKYLKEQEKLQYQSKITAHENRFNSILAEVNSLLSSISVQRKGLTAAGNSHTLVKRLAAVHSLSKLPARIRKLRSILLSIQAEPLIYNRDIEQYLQSTKNQRDVRHKKTEDRQVAAYGLLKSLETQMRLLIRTRLSKTSSNWWLERIPEDIRQRAELKREKNEKPSPWTEVINAMKGSIGRGSDLLEYVDFNDYIGIIRRRDNWREAFRDVFRDGEVISAKLKEIEPIRNAIAHSREISKQQLNRLELHVGDIIHSTSKFI